MTALTARFDGLPRSFRVCANAWSEPPTPGPSISVALRNVLQDAVAEVAQKNRTSVEPEDVLVALAAVLLLVLTGCTLGGDQEEELPEPSLSPSPIESTDPDEEPSDDEAALERFYGQKVRWRDCETGAECTRIKVPLDYADPAGRAIRLSVLRIPAASAKQRVGSLVVNPGGPGGSGVEYASNAASYFANGLKGRAMEDRYHDHVVRDASYELDVLESGNIARRTIPMRNAMNEVLRDAYVADCERAVAGAVERHGRLDVLVNCAGIALAALLMLGNRVWPGVWVGAALANYTVNNSLLAAVAIGTGNTLEGLLAAGLLELANEARDDAPAEQAGPAAAEPDTAAEGEPGAAVGGPADPGAAEVGAEAAPQAPALLKCLKDEDPRLRAATAYALGEIFNGLAA